MRIGIDVNDLHRPTTGIGRYILALVDSLGKDKPKEELFLFYKDDVGPIQESNVKMFQQVSRSETFWGQYWLPRMARKTRADILHCPSVRAPLFCSTPVVITVHDVIFKKYPQYFRRFDRNYMNILYSMVLRKCGHIIAVSQCTKNDIIKYYKIPPKKITVVHNGIESKFHPVNRETAVSALKEAGFSVPERFILFVGTIEPRKNVLSLIKAFEKARKTGIEHELVIIGKKGWIYEDVFNYLDTSSYVKYIHFFGHIEDSLLPSVYSLASIFVYPSLYEGFGYPVIESMACGTPVIVNDTPALVEIADNAAIVVNANSDSLLADAMVQLLGNSAKMEQLKDLGLKRAAELSILKSAQATFKVYKSLQG